LGRRCTTNWVGSIGLVDCRKRGERDVLEKKGSDVVNDGTQMCVCVRWAKKRLAAIVVEYFGVKARAQKRRGEKKKSSERGMNESSEQEEWEALNAGKIGALIQSGIGRCVGGRG
jgi:hypothetical protein